MAPGWAITPMEYYNSLVAGGDDGGFRDGAFALARFQNPSGLAFDESGNQLYVADSGNHRIRVVHLDQNNEVETLAGTGTAGETNGPLSTATFNYPNRIAALPEDRLAVYDAGSNVLRLIDLKTKSVSTIVRGIVIWDMVYRPKDNSLYFSEPGGKKIERIDMKSLVVSALFSNNTQIPSPAALCLYQDNLCVADSDLPTIYEVKPDNNSSSVTVSVSLLAVGNAKDVLALSSSDGLLYAFQKGGFLLKVGIPDSSIVKFPTPWGFVFKNQDHGLTFLNIQAGMPMGFSTSPSEPRKFFISTEHSIVSVKDYDFEEYWSAMEGNSREITDFNYPAKKPARTFRILVTGDSRCSTAVPISPDPNALINEDDSAGEIKGNTFSKRLEFLLNTEAALQNAKIHFEVLNLTRRGGAISTYAYYEVPDVVKKYDVDFVLGLAGAGGYIDYYMNPMTAEGIPSKSLDNEYILKPLSDRVPPGVASDLYERCKKLKIPVSEKQITPGEGWSLFCNGDARIQNDLKEMAGRRLQLLHEKLNSMKTSTGVCPQLVIFYIPFVSYPNDCCTSFWSDVCVRYHLNFLDLTESYNALKISYYPTNVIHYTAYGNELVAVLLNHFLIENKLIPFESNQK